MTTLTGGSGGRGPGFRRAGFGNTRYYIRSSSIDPDAGVPFRPSLFFPQGALTGGLPETPTEGLYGPGLLWAKGRPAVHASGFSSFPGTFVVRFETNQTLTSVTAFTPVLAFGVGTAINDQTVFSAVAFKPGLSFPQGVALNSVPIAGAAPFTPGLTFTAGSAIRHIQTDDTFTLAPTFPAGEIALVGTQTVVGSGNPFRPAFTFPTGHIGGRSHRGGGWGRGGRPRPPRRPTRVSRTVS